MAWIRGSIIALALVAAPQTARAHSRNVHEAMGRLALQSAEYHRGSWLPSRFRQLIEDGSWQEDYLPPDYVSLGPIENGEKTGFHGYNPITNGTGGIFLYVSGGPATTYSSTIWSTMNDHFCAGQIESGIDPADSEDASAYHRLGRVAHLVQDMTTHPHVHPQDVTPLEHSIFEDWEDATFLGNLATHLDVTRPPLQPTDAVPNEVIARLDSWSRERLASRTFASNDAAAFVEQVARITYFWTTFWGEVEFVVDSLSPSGGSATQAFTREASFGDGTVPGATHPNVLHVMFGEGSVRYINAFEDDYFEITDANGNGHTWKSTFDDEWFPCAPSDGGRRDGSIVINGSLDDPTAAGVRVTGRFQFTRADQVRPRRYQDSTTYDLATLAHSYTTYAWQAGLRYNAGLIIAANRRLRILASPGPAVVELSRADNLGNGNSTADSVGLARYFVTGETVTLTAAANDSNGRPFESWLRGGAEYAQSRSITVTINNDTAFTAIYSADADRDGYAPPTDCNDDNFSVHPGATELCNGIDDDCDAQTDEEGANGCGVYYRDSDDDGFGARGDSKCLCAASNPYRSSQGGDCDDTAAGVYPGAAELCNGRDDDCDDQIDEQGATGCTLFYLDADSDTYGLAGYALCLCAPAGSYRATRAGDCNDSHPGVLPGSVESCSDGIDNDCDGVADCAAASCLDTAACRACGDSRCDGALGEDPCTCPADCGTPPGREATGAGCLDGADNDCDGLVDAADGDCNGCGNGFCESNLSEDACTCVLDCGAPAQGEGPTITCADGIDNDCDSVIDCADADCASACSPVCGSATGDCCEPGGTPGCGDAACCQAVCACDPFCCDVQWDAECALQNTVVAGCDAATLCTSCRTFHPADVPQTWSGDCSCAVCEDSRIDECEALNYARAWQRGEHDDMAQATRTLYIAQTTGCYVWSALTDRWETAGCD